MRAGKILVAEQQGAFVIKLVGDVRVTLCVAFDDFLEHMLVPGGFHSVVIDLSEAEGIDSTTLGLLAKVAIHTSKKFAYTPVIVSTNESITRLIRSMGFDSVFDIRTRPLEAAAEWDALRVADCPEEEVRDKVIEAHRLLMGLSEDNRARFSELVTSLENH